MYFLCVLILKYLNNRHIFHFAVCSILCEAQRRYNVRSFISICKLRKGNLTMSFSEVKNATTKILPTSHDDGRYQ